MSEVLSHKDLKKSIAEEIQNIVSIILLKQKQISLIKNDLDNLHARRNHFTEKLNHLNKIDTKQAD